MRILVLGVSGMLGHMMFRVLAENSKLMIFGTARSESVRRHFPEGAGHQVLTGVDVTNVDSLLSVFGVVRPDVVVNCVGLVKQLGEANDPLKAIAINALLPHRLSALCSATGSRLIQISTDCVFSGSKGSYREADVPDATDLYGRTKLLGEVEYPYSVTLRTSIIGHELFGRHGLLEWFLAQVGTVKGFRRAVFSGVTTNELSRVVRDEILPNSALSGVFHVAAAPISKYDLLRQIAQTYSVSTTIDPDDHLVIDRSLIAERMKNAVGYVAPPWHDMLSEMHRRHYEDGCTHVQNR